MKKVVRKNVYETNSSSCHAIQISSDGLKPSEFKMDKDGYIHCDYGCFDYTGVYNTQYEKLSYLLTHAWSNSGCNDLDDEDIYNDCNFRSIQDGIKKHIPECKGIRIDMKSMPKLNHQLYGEDIINIWNEDEVVDFVFNSYIILKIFRD